MVQRVGRAGPHFEQGFEGNILDHVTLHDITLVKTVSTSFSFLYLIVNDRGQIDCNCHSMSGFNCSLLCESFCNCKHDCCHESFEGACMCLCRENTCYRLKYAAIIISSQMCFLHTVIGLISCFHHTNSVIFLSVTCEILVLSSFPLLISL